jgi:hypothetical protein
MKIPGFAQIRMAWRILRSLNRIADALERAYPPKNKNHSYTAEVVEFDEAGSEEQDLVSVRDGKVPWDVDEQ